MGTARMRGGEGGIAGEVRGKWGGHQMEIGTMERLGCREEGRWMRTERRVEREERNSLGVGWEQDTRVVTEFTIEFSTDWGDRPTPFQREQTKKKEHVKPACSGE